MIDNIEEIGYDKIDLRALEIKPQWNIQWYNQNDEYSEEDTADGGMFRFEKVMKD